MLNVLDKLTKQKYSAYFFGSMCISGVSTENSTDSKQ